MDQPEPKQAAPKAQEQQPQRQEQQGEATPVPQLQSLESLRSMGSINEENKQNADKPNEDQGQELQVIQSKVDKGINRDQIMRMFNEQLQKEQKEREEIQQRRLLMRQKSKDAPKPTLKRPAKQQPQKKVNKVQALQQALSEKSARIRKMIEPHYKKYRAMFRPSIYDSKMNRYRFQCKQKLFLNLCFGIQQLRSFAPQQLSELERQMLAKDPYYVVKRLATQIDAAFVKILNKGDKNDVSRQYKTQWETLLNNIKDQNNLELKRKILSGTFEPIKMATTNEIQFFTYAKREQILQKQKRYVAEFTVEKAIVKSNEDQAQQLLYRRPKVEEQVPEALPVLKSQRSSLANKYIEESSILQLEQLLGQGQLNKMMKRLEEDLQGKSQELLIKNFKEVFSL